MEKRLYIAFEIRYTALSGGGKSFCRNCIDTMKKTLMIVLALAGCSLAEDASLFPSRTSLSLQEVTSAQLAEIPATNATVALTLDVEEMKAVAGTNFNGSVAPVIFAFTGTWGASAAGELGVCNAGATGTRSGIYAYGKNGNSVSKNVSTGLDTLFTKDTDWNVIDSMSLVCSMVTNESGQVSITTAVSIRNTDGTITTHGGSSVTMHWGGTEGFTASGVTFDSALVNTSTTYRGALSLEEARALSVSLIPEPTTATLSLLALAGLAARRRR